MTVDAGRTVPRAYTVPGLPHVEATRLAIGWAQRQVEATGKPLHLYAPGKRNVQDSRQPPLVALLKQGIAVTTWREHRPAGVVVALWPDEEHLLEADESPGIAALVAVTWSPNSVLAWAQARNADPLGGPPPDINPHRPLDPTVAVGVESLGVVIGQHKPADQRHRAVIAKGLHLLRVAGYTLDPTALHIHALSHGWRADNAGSLRDIALRLNAGRTIQGMKTAALDDGAIRRWRHTASTR